MALIKCPECAREVSSHAPACPACGYPLRATGAPPAQPHNALQSPHVWGRVAVALGAWLCSVALFFVFISRAQADASYAVAPPKHAVIVVLGSGAPSCQPSATLQARLDRALGLAQRLPHARVLATGGKIAWQPCTEGQVMGNYLRAHGLQAGRIVQEERSTSTQENLRFSLPVLQAHGFNQQAHTLLLVTSDFHALRARLIARREGYSHIQSASAPTPLPQRYAAWLREYFAFISGWLLKEY